MKEQTIWKSLKEKDEQTETIEEAIEKIRNRLGWIVFLLVMILMALGDISTKLGN